jgi:short-subunit dehydrogenase
MIGESLAFLYISRLSNFGARGGDMNAWALVTGASSGIGAAFGRALRARGRKVVVVARRAERLEALVRELGGPDFATAIPTDLTASGAIGRLVGEIDKRGFTIDLLVNNAGAGYAGPFQEAPVDRILSIVDLNVRSLVELTRALLPGMVARRGGAVVNVVSTGAFQPVPYLAVYAASKSFVLSFTEGIATELAGTGVQVQALCPGFTETEFFEVAHTAPDLLVNRLPRMTPDQVVAASLRGLDAGRLRVIPGLPNRVLAALTSIAPSRLSRSVAASLYRPR